MDTLLYILGWVIHFETGFFAMKSSEFLLPLGDKLWQKIILLITYTFTIGMVFFIGDPVNLPPTIACFMTAVMISCKGTLLQRFTIGLMFFSASSALNALFDNLILAHANVPSNVLKLIFWCIFYVLMRHFSPPKDYELSPALWRLMLLLTSIPIGIICSVVLLTSPFYVLDDAVKWAFGACLFFALFSFIGLMWTIIVLAKQRKMELENMM